MSRRHLRATALAVAALFALPVIGAVVAPDTVTAAAASKKTKKKKTGKYQYQYVPNSSGRTGAWR